MRGKRSVPESILHRRPLRIVTRPSPLAVRQGEMCKSHLLSAYDLRDEDIILQCHTTQGDRYRGRISDIGGKGVFVKDIETLLLSGKADIAVHSLKDIPACLDGRFCLACMLPRGDSRDALIVPRSSDIESLSDLSDRTSIGTSSPRRIAQLGHLNADITTIDLRGNISTRLDSVINGRCDGAILACAGLTRLGDGLKHDYEALSVIPIGQDIFLPSAGQGTIAMEILQSDRDLGMFLGMVSDKETEIYAHCERCAVGVLDGSCLSPIGAFARRIGRARMRLDVMVFSRKGDEYFHEKGECTYDEGAALGKHLGHILREHIPASIFESWLTK